MKCLQEAYYGPEVVSEMVWPSYEMVAFLKTTKCKEEAVSVGVRWKYDQESCIVNQA